MASASQSFGNINTSTSDDFDMNDFVNFDQGFHNSPSPTSVKMEPHQSLDPRNITLQQSSQPRKQYNGPSHNYDQFRQQTGLPTGAISHVHAVNQFSNSNHVKPTNFGAAHFGGYNIAPDSGVEAQGSIDSQEFFIPGDNSDDFAVDPAAIASDSQPAATFRAWPGMHSQQAKQQAQAQVDTEQQKRDEALKSQKPLPSNFDQTFGQRPKSQTDSSDQQTNEQISKLLNQMRQSSNTSGDDNDDGNADFGDMSFNHGRRGEDDMDEDERLLNSDEGKKLSSKERRQLRNKVSARAFRSRRKEYITQLEGEVAAKNDECNDLKMTNRRLLEQNRQLTQLCKAMLSHPSFNNFMDDMSNDPSLLHAFAPQSQPSTATEPAQEQQVKQDPQQSQSAPSQPQPPQEQNIHVGMTMMPETNLDFSMLNLGANHWHNYQQPQIFMLHEVPTGPSFEELTSSALSGKDSFEPHIADTSEKTCTPAVKDLPRVSEAAIKAPQLADSDENEDIKDDPTFALYINAPVAAPSKTAVDLSTPLSQLEESLSDKPTHFFQLHVCSQQADADIIHDIDRLFARAEPVLRRIERATRYLDV